MNTYLDFDMIIGKKEHFLTGHFPAPSAQQTVEHKWVKTLWGLAFCFIFGRSDLIYPNFQDLWVSVLNVLSMEGTGKTTLDQKWDRNKI